MEEKHLKSGVSLDMSLPAEDNDHIDDSTDDFDSEHSKRCKLLLFIIGDEHYAIEIEKCIEIVEFHEFTAVPNMPSFVIGVVNVRGCIIPLLDIRLLWGLSNSPNSENSKIIVVEHEKGEICVLIDRIERVIEVERSAIQPPLSTVSEEVADFTTGVFYEQDRTLILLDITRIFTCSTIQNLERS